MERRFVLQRYNELTSDEKSRFKSGAINSKAVRVGPYFPDYVLFNRKGNPVEVGLFGGCEYHGHLTPTNSCTILSKFANEDTLNFHQQSYGSLANKLKIQIDYFKSQRISVNHVWECEWLNKYGPLREDQKIPLERLIPREGLRYFLLLFSVKSFLLFLFFKRGGRCESFGLFWNYKTDPDKKLVYIDCNRFDIKK